MVIAAQSHLARTREGLIEGINRLELQVMKYTYCIQRIYRYKLLSLTRTNLHQEEERLRHSERILNGKLKLKDVKNEINHAQSELVHCINGLQENIQVWNICRYNFIYFIARNIYTIYSRNTNLETQKNALLVSY